MRMPSFPQPPNPAAPPNPALALLQRCCHYIKYEQPGDTTLHRLRRCSGTYFLGPRIHFTDTAATQLLFALSSAERWGGNHEGLDFYDTYYHIIDHFEGDHNHLNGSKDLLKWWDRYVLSFNLLVLVLILQQSGLSASKAFSDDRRG